MSSLTPIPKEPWSLDNNTMDTGEPMSSSAIYSTVFFPFVHPSEVDEFRSRAAGAVGGYKMDSGRYNGPGAMGHLAPSCVMEARP